MAGGAVVLQPSARGRPGSVNLVERHHATDAPLASAPVNERRRRDVLNRHSRAVENEHFVTASASRLPTGDDVAKLRVNVLAPHRTGLDGISVANKQYRNDIGSRVNADIAKLQSWGWMDA